MYYLKHILSQNSKLFILGAVEILFSYSRISYQPSFGMFVFKHKTSCVQGILQTIVLTNQQWSVKGNYEATINKLSLFNNIFYESVHLVQGNLFDEVWRFFFLFLHSLCHENDRMIELKSWFGNSKKLSSKHFQLSQRGFRLFLSRRKSIHHFWLMIKRYCFFL
jgi:hypothetical protein